jgi:hypothetical protein
LCKTSNSTARPQLALDRFCYEHRIGMLLDPREEARRRTLHAIGETFSWLVPLAVAFLDTIRSWSFFCVLAVLTLAGVVVAKQCKACYHLLNEYMAPAGGLPDYERKKVD